ncbi:MAG: cobaltochelatase subunit CobN [Alistipes sp.]|nr:cobaltochelatase subunit CobN [Alistipes sp.]
MNSITQRIIAGCAVAAVVAAGIASWQAWCGTTRIAFVNYRAVELGQIARSNDNPRISIAELTPDRFDRAGGCDMIFVNGMGLRITAEQRAQLMRAAEKGVPVLTTAATNPDNDITSLDSLAAAQMKAYLAAGGRRNYRNMLRYVRKHVDGKRFFAEEPEAAVSRTLGMLYHADPQHPEAEEREFGSVAEYEAFLDANGLLKKEVPGILVTGAMGDPTDLVRRLEETGNRVYPVRDPMEFVGGGHADSVAAAAVVNMAHGRMGDRMVGWLRKRNIPLFTTLNVNRPVEEWENDPTGMSGGFLSQSIVTPEIDGAIRPFVLFGLYRDKEGLPEVRAIPERLESFVEAVNNHIALQRKPNGEKRVAVYYYKGPGQSALTASGMEVAPSLYNLLVRMKRDGYKVEGLPASAAGLERMIREQGALFGSYAEGAAADYLRTGRPALVAREEYESWAAQTLRPEKYAEVTAAFGSFPGEHMATEEGRLGVARIELGNIVLLPQPAAGTGGDSFAMVHGTDAAPPHPYIASYLWARYGFRADALIHFGTHGSLEFTPGKQVAPSAADWPDRLAGPLPHFYVYSIGNVGEGMIAKRRAYAVLQSYLTPPFMESNVRGIYRDLCDAVKEYNTLAGNEAPDPAAIGRAALAVKRIAVKLGLHRDLGLDNLTTTPCTEAEIARIENFAEELVAEKVTGQLYTMGVPYDEERIASSVRAMTVDPIAYGLLALDKLRGRAAADVEKHRSLFAARYLEPARRLVERLLADPAAASDATICRIAGLTPEELAEAREIERSQQAPQGMMAMMMAQMQTPAAAPQPATAARNPENPMQAKMREKAKGMDPDKVLKMAKLMGAGPEALKKMEAAMKGGAPTPAESEKTGKTPSPMAAMMTAMTGVKKEYTKEEIRTARAILEVERAVRNAGNYRDALHRSPETELSSLMNALSGGYTAPSPGGDPIANPNTLPTGRNLYAINAEATPSAEAWEKGVALVRNTLETYRRRHNDSLPRKVAYTLWSGEFIETEGATVAQILYMLGVEPVRDAFGRVTDLRLIPSAELGRPRIDVAVQTSGQLRDIAASRLFLIERAVEMAAAATGDAYDNLVAAGTVEAERRLLEKGLTPKEAREVSTFRVFGGLNGGYGTGIQGMVMAGDRWSDETEIAEVYLNNMNAYYGSEKDWESVRAFAFEAALTGTDAVVQPRQSNTWGALSLDHVYEFMGGMNLAARHVTGKDPDAYLSDYRNRSNVRMQEVKEAIGAESRTTLFNPNYIREKMKGDAGSAETFAEAVRNTYGWNVMKPAAVDDELWNEIHEVYIRDKFALGTKDYFEKTNPAALQEMTAVMLESARKGLWKASEQQVRELAGLHTELVNAHGPSGSAFVCDNAALRKYIASKTDARDAAEYLRRLERLRETQTAPNDKGVVMRREELTPAAEKKTNAVSNAAVALVVTALLAAIALIIKRRK